MMNPTPSSLRVQWVYLLALTAAHFVLDTFPGLMHTVLPAFQTSFELSVSAGAILLTVFLIASNGIQVFIGHIRPGRHKPLLLYIGLLLTCTILLFWVVPNTDATLVWLSVIALASGAGVGMTHPEALRAIHRLDGISSALSSTIFMGGGIFGFAAGGWVSTLLFTRWQFWGLVPFCAAAILTAVLLAGMRVRLAIEEPDTASDKPKPRAGINFWLILGIAALTVSSVQILLWIVPQHISRMGAELALGGLTVSLFSLAGGIGGIVLSRFADHGRELKIVIRMLLAGIPFIMAYILLVHYAWSWMLLCAGGFFCFGTYPLMVSAARGASGANLGRRMGFVVGGVWLIACVLPVIFGPIAQRWGTLPILFCVPVGFVLSLLLAIAGQKKTANERKFFRQDLQDKQDF